MDPRVVLAAAALLVTALAGCAESEEGGAIKIVSRPDDGATQPIVLEAAVSADSYEWDMGDGRPKVTGKRVEHVYGATDGAFTVKLTTTKDGEKTQHEPLRLVLGSGQNAAPSFHLVAEWQWVQVGEEFTLSGAGSTDPEGDTLLFSWFCQPQGPIALAGAGHAHGGGGGVPYGTGSVNVIPLRVLNGTDVPAADRTVSGDMCADIPSGFSEEGSIRGKFMEPGLYEITMLAKDPAHPAVPGGIMMYVSQAPRQNATETIAFPGKIQYGMPAQLDDALATAGQQEYLDTHTFRIKYPIIGARFSLSHDDGAGVPASMGYKVLKGTTSKIPETSDDTLKGAGDLTPGDYQAVVALREGAEVEYTLTIEMTYETDPMIIFEGPH